MELRHLRYALALAEHRHFGRAARGLGIAQPPLSRQIAALERELGTTLFDRRPGGVVPTAAGEVWIAHARRVLEQVEAGAEDARRAARGQSGVLRLAFVGSALVQLLPPLLARFRATHGAVELRCSELASTRSTAALLAGEIDVAVSRGAPRGRGAEQLTSIPVGRDQLVAVCHRGHPFATRPAVTVDQLRSAPLVTTSDEDEPGTVGALAAVLDGRSPTLATTLARDVHTIAGLAACGVGVGLLPSCARGVSRTETTVLEVRPALRLPDLCLVTRTDDGSPTLAAFLAVAVEHCSEVREALERRSGATSVVAADGNP
ncbi:LysR family transcriptional regulator [Pseudonocardia sp. HH130630-07]|uniref:LysR family transcriptional regulator n=1 Tax=Pseudonocardia sp. HH130630-07 TaxID=1690815 RepID=UPI0008150230|nr:LysR family transcriptional regulator [Pseudonocardia sp. HH130630-07]ANY09384.1 LysR family transcriptional regulator [Pseudonocardia sp. HH130630-07]